MNEEIDHHNRSVMLQRIKLFWLKGVLEESLHGAELIDLGLAYRPSAVASGRDLGWDQTAEYDTPLPIGTRISDVFNAAEGELLIMGEPGAGKTTMLLSLVEDLLLQAQQDSSRPIPVVFSLASWTSSQTLAEWMVSQLSNTYEVPAQLGRFWIDENQLLPLLDGLDEVEKEQRVACAAAINQFRQTHTNKTLVTCRSQDYKALNVLLRLDKAIVLQPLTLPQIDQYLAGRGARLAGLRAALQTDDTLRELAETPLMLSIMTLAYYRLPEEAALALGRSNLGRSFLFDVYVERMTRYRDGEKTVDPDTAVHWLSWLATKMAEQNRTILFLESIQPNWLPRSYQRQLSNRIKLLIWLLFTGAGLLAGLSGIGNYGWSAPLAGGAIGAVAGGLIVLSGRLLPTTKANWITIDTVETLDWSWPWAWFGLGVGGALGGLLGYGFTRLLEPSVAWGLLFAVWGAGLFILQKAIVPSEVKLRNTPALGIEQSRRNGRNVATISAVILTLIPLLILSALQLTGLPIAWGQTLPWLFGGALFLALAGGLATGGLTAIKYQRLIRQIHALNLLSDDPVTFLDYAAERNLMRKVGGGYTFAHALLSDYFRQQETNSFS